MNARSWRWMAMALTAAAAASGCEDPNAAQGEAQFECASIEDPAGLVFCDDFNDGDATGWEPEAGSWAVRSGRYLGAGPMEVDRSVCGASRMAAAIRDGSETRDLALHARIGSQARLDKTLVLRAQDPSNRIELNFRAHPLNDLVVQEIVGCEVTFYTEEGEIFVPHTNEDEIEVEAQLVGQHLTVHVDGEMVLDREFELSSERGHAGVAVIDNAMTTFDDVWVREL